MTAKTYFLVCDRRDHFKPTDSPKYRRALGNMERDLAARVRRLVESDPIAQLKSALDLSFSHFKPVKP